MQRSDEYYMKAALKEAALALKADEVPIGCVLVDENGIIIAKAHNEKEEKNDVSAHAEILCIKKAGKKLKNWRLNNYTLYITLEPCLMCSSAIIQARIKRVVFGAKEPNTGSFGSHNDICELEATNIEVTSGVLEEECRLILQNFFKKHRNKK